MSTRSFYVALGALGAFYLQVRGMLVTADLLQMDGPCVVVGIILLAAVFTAKFVVIIGR